MGLNLGDVAEDLGIWERLQEPCSLKQDRVWVSVSDDGELHPTSSMFETPELNNQWGDIFQGHLPVLFRCTGVVEAPEDRTPVLECRRDCRAGAVCDPGWDLGSENRR